MLQRLLGGLGFMPSLPSGSAGEEGPDADGQASISFVPGRKVALSPDEDDESPDDRRARLTERDLVWPGKTEQIQIGNPEAMAYRYDLTVTDLTAGYYVRRPPVGGQWQPEGGVLLQPGEEAAFEVVFVPPPPADKTRTRTFSFVLTRFDPRRSADPGEIVQDLPLRWAALPTDADLKVTTTPHQVVTRPWRRQSVFQVQLQNKSFLPLGVEMQIARAATKEALVKEPEPVGSFHQALSPRTPGVWHCLLPRYEAGGSYYAGVTGRAKMGENVEHALTAPKPVHVRFIPWLRLGRDWVFLVGTLLLLVWLIWGVPVPKRPLVHLTVDFSDLDKGAMPQDGSLQDLSANLILLDKRGNDEDGQPHIPGVFRNDHIEFTGPARWYGFRWALGDHIGWNGFSREPQQFRLEVTPKAGKENEFRRYDFASATPENGIQAFQYAVSDSPGALGDWPMQAALLVPRIHGVTVQLHLGDLGGLRDKDIRQLSVTYTLGGQPQPPQIFPILRDPQGRLLPLTLDLTDQVPPGSPVAFSVDAVALGSVHCNPVDYLQVHRQPRPFDVTLTFPQTIPLTPDQIAAAQTKDKADAAQAAKIKADQEKKKKGKVVPVPVVTHPKKHPHTTPIKNPTQIASGTTGGPVVNPITNGNTNTGNAGNTNTGNTNAGSNTGSVVVPPTPLPDFLLADGDPAKVQAALNAANQQLAASPHDPLTLAATGFLLYQQGADAQGAPYFREASYYLKSSPQLASEGPRVASLLQLALGVSFQRRNDPDKAREHYTKATTKDLIVAAYAHYRLALFYSNQPNASASDILPELAAAKSADPGIAALPGYAALAQKYQAGQ